MFSSIDDLKWEYAYDSMNSKKFICGYCGHENISTKGYKCLRITGQPLAHIYLCACGNPTFFHGAAQMPSPKYGESLEHLPPEIKQLYDSARSCMSVNAYSSAVLTCRKILMHVAVEEGATKGQKFIEYVEYLSANILPEKHQSWVDKIRTMGNDETHEIKVASVEDAKTIIDFTEMLLRLIYEYPQKANSAGNAGTQKPAIASGAAPVITSIRSP